jgi:uncharacterized protein
MEAFEFVQLVISALGGEINGKTKLQKSVYFLGLMTGCLDDLGFRPHFYGPYSDDVAEAVNRLKTIGAVDQNVRGGCAVDKAGFEVCRYDYSLNDEGRELAEETARYNRKLTTELRKAVEAFKAVGDLDYMELSIAAKTYFMLGEKKGRATNSELANLARKFGWDVTPKQIRDAANHLSRLGLVEVADC